ncbi:MAG: 3-phosphoshikimate 1-carboxyvinyltransferase [uncultured Thermomicrobiales bacterium]|uniref:3-phosphoshikimate 1-carboxyvinyltransferase n=1 Tax=uncultured Thermomicrobiales bacterium TaxID=1645740 RepID=A0A6J4V1L4_9BACT|nr:MAG: 3-phosphoshikimate 1-carboxyvinyltransferase [uncultured Thermomicrobiales bacterium]
MSSATVAPAARPIDAVARVPGSKSITNRALLIAALADGDSELVGALDSEDTRYMAAALNALGIPVQADAAGERFRVRGGGGSFPATEADLFVGNSGTSMRFLTAALPLGRGVYRIDGVPRMRQRPIAPLLDALNDLGADARGQAEAGFPPVTVRAAGLRGGRTRMAGDLSSQFLSALVQAAPYAAAGVEVEVVGDLVSKPYLPLTAAVMAAFGVELVWDRDGWRWFRVAPGQRYRGRVYRVEPDASNASYFFAAAAVTGGRVRVEGLGAGSAQGDLRFVDVLAAMGCAVEVTGGWVEVRGPEGGALRGVDLDLGAISDTAQTLAAIAPFASGPTTIRGVGHARLKETDRVAALATELRRLGQDVVERPDGLTITPAPIVPAAIETYDDHRMAMSFAITALRAPGIAILDPGCVAKTFPAFFDRLAEATGTGTRG